MLLRSKAYYRDINDQLFFLPFFSFFASLLSVFSHNLKYKVGSNITNSCLCLHQLILSFVLFFLLLVNWKQYMWESTSNKLRTLTHVYKHIVLMEGWKMIKVDRNIYLITFRRSVSYLLRISLMSLLPFRHVRLR